ncbi:hypothetical protein C1A38_11375 [Verrucosispora sp. ts21]|nr:hypothetical protein C1A38_11375 [Verrucosispora sp. ts21]
MPFEAICQLLDGCSNYRQEAFGFLVYDGQQIPCRLGEDRRSVDVPRCHRTKVLSWCPEHSLKPGLKRGGIYELWFACRPLSHRGELSY